MKTQINIFWENELEVLNGVIVCINLTVNYMIMSWIKLEGKIAVPFLHSSAYGAISLYLKAIMALDTAMIKESRNM